MDIQYTDDEITRLIAEPKVLPSNYLARFQPKPKRGHSEQHLDLQGEDGSVFKIVLRLSLLNSIDFSVILACVPAQYVQLFRLRRYNGKSHQHTNTIEGNTFYDFHIHTATERYQNRGMREDVYAEPTTLYTDFQTALQVMLHQCGFVLPESPQRSLF